MKKKTFIVSSFIIGVLALGFILKYIPFDEVIKSFVSAKLKYIVGYLLVSIAIMIILTWRWRVILKSQNLDISFLSLFNYRVVGYGISYLTPSAKLGGEPVRAMLLSNNNINFSKALSTVVIDKTIEITSSALFFFMGAIFVVFMFALPGKTDMVLLSSSTILLAFIIFIYERLVSGKGFLVDFFKFLRIDKIKKLKISEKKLASFEKLIITFFRRDKKDFIMTMFISLIGWMLMFFEFKFVLLILGHDASLMSLYLIISFIGAAFIFPIPLGLGSVEASQVALFPIIGMKSAVGIALSLVTRARDVVWSIIGLGLLSYYGLNAKKTIRKAYINNNNIKK